VYSLGKLSVQDTLAFYIRIKPRVRRFAFIGIDLYAFPSFNMCSIIDINAVAAVAASQSTLTGCLLFTTTLDYISHAGYPPTMRGRMHVNANVYCLGTGSRLNRKNDVMASPRSRENYIVLKRNENSFV